MFSTCPFVRPTVRPSVRCQTCEHDILKTNEPIMVQISTSGPIHKAQGRNGQLWGQEVKGQVYTRPKLHWKPGASL